jgi:hypothetical protein
MFCVLATQGDQVKKLLLILVFTLSLTVCAQKTNPDDIKVWVNTPTHVYHCPGDRWYGNTKSGEYMTQKQARDAGDRPDHGKVCR